MNPSLRAMRRLVFLAAILVGVIIGLAVADVSVAVLIGIMLVGLVVVVVPVLAIHYEEHEDRFRRPGPHS